MSPGVVLRHAGIPKGLPRFAGSQPSQAADGPILHQFIFERQVLDEHCECLGDAGVAECGQQQPANLIVRRGTGCGNQLRGMIGRIFFEFGAEDILSHAS